MQNITKFLSFVFTIIFIHIFNFVYCENLPLLHQDGPYIRDTNNEITTLNGCNLGNWLVLEMWMSNFDNSMTDQYSMEQLLTSRFGESEKDRLMDVYRDNYITERDFQIIKSFNMNCIRLPFWYTILMDSDAAPYTLKADAWKYLDWAIDTAESYGIYTILDMHGAPGSQSPYDHTGRANYNQLFFDTAYQDQTVWLWEQIANRYKDRACVFGYDLLNEPWGSTTTDLRNLTKRIYDAVRAVDQNHIVILHNYFNDVTFYGNPATDLGMENVCFTTHPYPGIFDGTSTVETHIEWLTNGVFDWRDNQFLNNTPYFVGEFQIQYKSAGGGEMIRAAYDTYNGFGWSATLWSYKIFHDDGGIGDGIWGMVTNEKVQPLIKAETWTSDDWDNSFQEAPVSHEIYFVAPGEGTATFYLVIKAGILSSTSTSILDVTFDNISLIEDSTAVEKVVNGGFGSSDGWTNWTAAGTINVDYNRISGLNPTGSSGACLRITRTGTTANGGIYQPITLTGGELYTLSGVFRDSGSDVSSVWAEVYLMTNVPVDGQDYLDTAIDFPDLDTGGSSKAEIEAYFESLSTMNYAVDQDLRLWMNTDEQPGFFTNGIYGQHSYGTNPIAVPGTVQAENFDQGDNGVAYWDDSDGNSGNQYRLSDEVDIENCFDTGGGYNVGYISPYEWMDYQIDVAETGFYNITCRVASDTSGGKFHLEFDGIDKTGDIIVPITGDWQSWTNVNVNNIKLIEGTHELTFVSETVLGQAFNINYMQFSLQSTGLSIDNEMMY